LTHDETQSLEQVTQVSPLYKLYNIAFLLQKTYSFQNGVEQSNGKTFGNEHEHRDHQTSWVHSDEDRRQEGYGRIGQGFP
jgi:hypothetical protein